MNQNGLFEKALMLATDDPKVKTSSDAYDFVTKELELTKAQRPALRRVKAGLVKELERKIEVLK